VAVEEEEFASGDEFASVAMADLARGAGTAAGAAGAEAGAAGAGEGAGGGAGEGAGGGAGGGGNVGEEGRREKETMDMTQGRPVDDKMLFPCMAESRQEMGVAGRTVLGPPYSNQFLLLEDVVLEPPKSR